MYSLEAKEEGRKFHKLLGGMYRIDFRYWDRPIAREIRTYMKSLVEEGHTVSEVAKILGISEGNLSMAMGGRAGEKKMETIKMRLSSGVVDRSFSLT